MHLDSRPRQAPWVEAESVEGDKLRLTFNRGQSQFVLNETSKLIWQLCDGNKTTGELLDFLAQSYPDQTNVRDEVTQLFDKLTEKRLIVFDGGDDALEYQGEVVRKFVPPVELQWQLEQIRQFLFGVMRVTEADAMQSDLDQLMGQAALENAKQQDVDSASQIGDSSVIPYRGAMKSPSFSACMDAIVVELNKLLPEVTTPITVSGHAVYLRGSHMGWHANHSRSDGRIYCSWAERPNANFFRYEHPITGEVITEWEEPGWNIKSFTIPPATNRFWHCIGAGSLRLSLGFRYALPDQ